MGTVLFSLEYIKMDIVRAEVVLRLFAIVLLVLTACLVRFDSQTKIIFYTIVRKATFRDLNALTVLVYVDSVAAGYNLLQLVKKFLSCRFKGNPMIFSYLNQAWICFLLDQATVYLVFAANLAAFQASLLAVTGAQSFQWMKLCNRFTRFCFQIGGALFCGFLASILLITLSFMSAFSLFRLYSPKQFLLLKARS